MVPEEPGIRYFRSLEGPVEVRFLLFDLDNTLYPKNSGLAAEMEQRIAAYAEGWLNLDAETCLAQRKEGFSRYGSTLRWLMMEKGLEDPRVFLEYVHPADLESWLQPLPQLAPMLEAIPLPKAILTNSPLFHARRVLDFFGISGLFGYVKDITGNNFLGKPAESAYLSTLQELGWNAEHTLFIDDMVPYLDSFRALGGQCCLVGGSPRTPASYPRIPDIMGLPGVLLDQLG